MPRRAVPTPPERPPGTGIRPAGSSSRSIHPPAMRATSGYRTSGKATTRGASMSWRWIQGAGLVLLGLMTLPGLAGCERHPDPSADGGLLESPEDWPSFGRTAGEQHYSPLDQIDRDSVGRLSLAWYHDLEPGNTVTAPVSAGGKLFVTTGHSHVRAFDGATGSLLWEYDSRTRERAGFILRFGYGTKGLAYWNGRVFIATHDGHVVALDANDR